MTNQRKPRPFVPGVIVCHGKHSTDIYDASTPEKLRQAALTILKRRDGYYYIDPGELYENYGAQPAPYSDEQLAKLEIMAREIDDESLIVNAKTKMKIWSNNRRDYEDALDWWDNKDRALIEHDGGLAWSLLQRRCDHEYERVELEHFCSIDPEFLEE